jgi:hypothetical protein
MDKSFVRIIQAIMLAAAVLGLLLTTPSIEARTRHQAKSHAKSQSIHQAKHHAKKKMKIVFDGSEPASPQGELGDEIVQPLASDRKFVEPGALVQMRGSSVDELWKKNKLASRTHAKARAEKNADFVDENPDLIEPVAFREIETPASLRSSEKTVLVDNPSLDESALGSFQTSQSSAQRVKIAKSQKVGKIAPKKLARMKTLASKTASNSPNETFSAQTRPALVPEKPAFVPEMYEIAKAETIAPLPTPIIEFDEVKPVARVKRKAASRISLRKVRPVAPSNSLATRATSNEPSEFKFNFAFENTTTLGRKYELEAPGGRNYLMKNEIFVGAAHSSEWGAKISLDYVATSNDDATKDSHEMGDPSLIVEHPSIFKNRDVNIRGQIRYFLPVATTSKAKGLQQFAYSLIAEMQLVEQLSLVNIFVPRYYLQATYADTDAFSLVSDSTEVSRTFDWFGAGLGQRTQVESHQAISPGTSVEVYPFLSFLRISNAIIEAKYYIPLISSGLVNGAPGSSSGPTTGGFSGAQAEFFARLSF